MLSTESSSDPVDLCLVKPTFSGERFMFFLPVFLTMTVGSAILFFLFANSWLGIESGALVCYTSAVVLYTFSANRGLPRYMFECPIVRAEIPRLFKRHLAFISALIVLLTIGLQVRRYLPPWWLVASGAPKSMPPLTTVLFVLSACLALAQILTNRSALEQAHRRHAEGDTDK